MVEVVATTLVLVFSSACFIILTPNILLEAASGLSSGIAGAETGGSAAAVAWRSAVRIIRHSGDQRRASCALTVAMLACRCLSRGTENQPRTGCQCDIGDCLAVTYWPSEVSSCVSAATTAIRSGGWSLAGHCATSCTRLAVRQRA